MRYKYLPSGGLVVIELEGQYVGLITAMFASNGDLLDVYKTVQDKIRLVEIGSRTWIYAEMVGRHIIEGTPIDLHKISENAAILSYKVNKRSTIKQRHHKF